MSFLLPIPIFLFVAAGLVGVLKVGRRLFPGTHTVSRAFHCPFRDENVAVDFKETVWDATLMDVDACTAFSPPQDVRCDKGCLRLGKLPRATAKEAVATH